MREIYINERLLRCCYTFISGNVFGRLASLPRYILSPLNLLLFTKKNKKQNRKRKTKGDFHGSSSFTIYDSFSAPFSLNAYNWLVWPYTKRRRRLYARWCCCWCSCSMFNRLSLKYTKKMRSRHGSGGARRWRLSYYSQHKIRFLFISSRFQQYILVSSSSILDRNMSKKRQKCESYYYTI